jgi:hypothetical protein
MWRPLNGLDGVNNVVFDRLPFLGRGEFAYINQALNTDYLHQILLPFDLDSFPRQKQRALRTKPFLKAAFSEPRPTGISSLGKDFCGLVQAG